MDESGYKAQLRPEILIKEFGRLIDILDPLPLEIFLPWRTVILYPYPCKKINVFSESKAICNYVCDIQLKAARPVP